MNYSEAQMVQFAEIARKRTETASGEGDPTVRVVRLQPDGAETEEEFVNVVVRPFRRAEFADYTTKASSYTDNYNTALTLLIAVDDKTGKEAVDAFRRLLDGNDALNSILTEAAEPMGVLDESQIRWARLTSRTTAEEAESFGLPARVLDLVKLHSEPGSLRMIEQHGVPAVVRRPTRDEWTRAHKDVKRLFTTTSDMALSCVLEPSHIDERRALFNRIPAFGYNLYPIFQQMRNVGAESLGKGSGRRSDAPRG